MKYFTPELLARIRSEDDDVSWPAHDEWEVAIARYRRRLNKLVDKFPEGVSRFEEDSVCLHDARVLSIARQGEQLLMVLEPEPPATTAVVLTFTLEGTPVIDPEALPDGATGDWITWMYEEWDIDRKGNCWFEVLLTNGWSVRLRFRDFNYQILDRLFPAPPVAKESAQKPAVPRSA